MKTLSFRGARAFAYVSFAALLAGCTPSVNDGGDPPEEQLPPDAEEEAADLARVSRPGGEAVCTVSAPTSASAWTVAEGLDESTVRSVTATNKAVYLFDYRGVRQSLDQGATWKKLTGLPVDYARAVAGSGDDLFVTGYVNGVGSATFQSKDDGETWTPVIELDGLSVQSLYTSGTTVIADAFFWTPASDVFAELTNENFLFLFASDGSTHLGAAYAATFRSTDGQTWTQIEGLDGFITARLAIAGQIAFAVEHQGELRRSLDGGVTWEPVEWDMEVHGTIGDVRIEGETLLLATTKGLVRSTDLGATFSVAVESPSTFTDPFFDQTTRIAKTDGALVLSASDVFRSSNGGDSWTQAPEILDATPFALGASPDFLFAATADMKLHASEDGVSWFEIETEGFTMHDFARSADTSFLLVRAAPPDGSAGYADGELVALRDGGNAFTYVERPYETQPSTFAEVHVHDGVLLLGAQATQATTGENPVLGGAGLFRSVDGGETWEIANDGIESVGKDYYTYKKIFPGVLELHSVGSDLFVALSDGTVMRSADGAVSWTPAGEGLPGLDPQTFGSIDVFGSTNGVFVATSRYAGGLFGFDAKDGRWSPVGAAGLPDGFRIEKLLGHGGALFAAVRSSDADAGGVFVSVDGGDSWQPAGLEHPSRELVLRGDTLYAGTDGDALWSLGLEACTVE